MVERSKYFRSKTPPSQVTSCMVTTLGSQEWSLPAPLEVVTGCGGVGRTFSNSEEDWFVDFPVVLEPMLAKLLEPMLAILMATMLVMLAPMLVMLAWMMDRLRCWEEAFFPQLDGCPIFSAVTALVNLFPPLEINRSLHLWKLFGWGD